MLQSYINKGQGYMQNYILAHFCSKLRFLKNTAQFAVRNSCYRSINLGFIKCEQFM